jgi:hypothetical protein
VSKIITGVSKILGLIVVMREGFNVGLYVGAKEDE